MNSKLPLPLDFDPYYHWLGLPRDQRPPTHYQLLGISPTEEDRVTIEAAIKRQTTLVRTQKEAKQEDVANRVLYEIQEAGVLVLDIHRRKKYDEFLARQQSTPKRRLIAEPLPPYQSSRAVGEETEFVRSYLGIVSILLGAFIIMAVVSFMLPWREVMFGEPEKKEANAQPVPAKIGERQVIRRGDKGNEKRDAGIAARQAPAAEQRPQAPVELVSIDAHIVAVDTPSRLITLSHKSRNVKLDVSRTASISVDGVEAALDTLVPGQTAQVEFNPEFDVATKIQVTPTEDNPEAAASQVAGPDNALSDGFVTAEVTIRSIDLAARTMTVAYKSKDAVFELSRKTEVSIGGNSGPLDALLPDQQAIISFDPEHDVIAKVEVAVPTAESPTATPSPTNVTSDELATIEATITAIDLEARSVSVTRNSKTTTFDISRKAEVVLDGKAATLDGIKPGQQATITLNAELNVIVKIEVPASAPPADEKN